VVVKVGALVAGPLVDALTARCHRCKDVSYYGHGGGDSFDVDGGDAIDDDDDDVNDRGPARDDASSTPSSSSAWAMTANRAIMLSGVFANLAAALVTFTVREIKVDDSSGGSSSSDNDNDDDGEHSNHRDHRRRWHGMPRRRCG